MTSKDQAGEKLVAAAKESAKVGWRAVRRVTRSRDLERLQSGDGPIRVILGAGFHRRPGWVATDLFPRGWDVAYLDLSKRFPFADGTVERVYAEHVIEHVPLETAEFMLSEIHRVLAPGGRVRIATPDLDRIAMLCNRPLSPDSQRYVTESNALFLAPDSPLMDEPTVALNRIFRDHGHQFLFDREFLTKLLLRHGFDEVLPKAVGESDDPAFRNLEDHGERIGKFCNEYETMVFEATRP